ncbi:MAG: hypothetical protein ACYC0C_07430 [Devosia sp.]
MKLFGPLSRSIAVAGLVVTSMMAATPALAAKADIELLNSYLGNWKGKGILVGDQSETVKCHLSLTPGNQDKVIYSGRCALAGTILSVNGTLAYIDAKKRYEAAMSTNATFNGTAVGQKQGDGVVFNLRERETDEEGNDMTITAVIALLNKKISVEFQVLFNASGDILRASVPFTK